ncbi:hypothetical protein CR513_56713, partial [Mucuna pruriens]
MTEKEAIIRDTSSSVSLCAKLSEVKSRVCRVCLLRVELTLYAFDPEIEKTFSRLRKAMNLVVNNSRSFDSIINSNQLCTNNSVASSNIFAEPRQMENNDRTLKELATQDVVYQPWCIQYPQLEPAQTYELKSGLIHLLPKFHGLAGEDPHKYLKEFHVVCSTIKP